MTSSSARPSSRSGADRVLAGSLRLAAATAGAIVLGIFAFLVLESAPLIARLGPSRFATDGRWSPTTGRFDLTAMVAGSLLATAGGLLVAVPLGLGSAVFARFYAPPWLADLHRRQVEILAGIPSVVYGLWGLLVLVPAIARLRPPGASLLAAASILGLMVLPTVALLADAALGAVRPSVLQAAAAVGLSRPTTIRRLALPAARGGLATAVLLATGRAIGETMAVLMVAGNVAAVPSSVFDPVRTLTAGIALEMAYASGDHRSALFVCGLVLAAIVVALVAAADLAGTGGGSGG